MRKLAAWIGVLVSRIATRFGVNPVFVKGILVLVLAVVVIVAIVVPISVFAQKTAPAAATAAAPTHKPATPKPTVNDALADGPCEALLDPAAVADSLGAFVDAKVESRSLVFAAVGGYDCEFTYWEESAEVPHTAAENTGRVEVRVVPSAIVDSDARDASLTPLQCSLMPFAAPWNGECSSTVATRDWWYSLRVQNSSDLTELRASFVAISEQLERTLSIAPAASQAMVVAPFQCSSADTESALVYAYRGESTYSLDNLGAAASLLAAPVTCASRETNGENWKFTVYPGGTSVYEACKESGEVGSTLSVPGVASAFAPGESWGAYGVTVCASDGTSTVVVTRSPDPGQGLAPWDDHVRDELSSLLVPIFTAILVPSSPFVASSTSSTGAVAPSPLVGGDCGALLDPATLNALVGGAPETSVRSTDLEIGLVGGIDCAYRFAISAEPYADGIGWVHVSAAPSAIVDPAILSSSLSALDCHTSVDRPGSLYSECAAAVATSGWWYTLELHTRQAEDEIRATFATITAMLEGTLRAAKAPARVDVVTPFDCEDAEPIGPSMVRSRGLGPGGSPINAAVFLLVGPARCSYGAPDGKWWELTVYPSRSSFNACLQEGVYPWALPAEPIAVQGVEAVYALHSGDATMACALDGSTMVRVLVVNHYEWDEAMRTTLSQLLVPVFAAAD